MATAIDDSLHSLLRDWLRHFSGTATLKRGDAYFQEGAVVSKRFDGEMLVGIVRGSTDYRVKLWTDDGAVAHSCTCPIGDEGCFCKHGVALALAWLDGGDAAASPAVTMEDVREYLRCRPASELIELLLAQAKNDDALHRRLLLWAGKEKGLEPAVEAIRGAFDDATDVPDYVAYDEVGGHARRLHEVVDEVEELFAAGYASEAASLCEYGIGAVAETVENFDDSNGTILGVAERLADLHLAACEKARPEPRVLAELLFGWNTDEGFHFTGDATGGYAEILGEEGFAAYREMAEAAWEKLPPLGPKDSREWDGRRRRLREIMEGLARKSGDEAALLAIITRDLSSPGAFLDLARFHKAAGRTDEALAWAERGWTVFASGPKDERLRDFLVDAYHAAGRHDEAIALVWEVFRQIRGVHQWETLKESAQRAGSWPAWRDKAFAVLRAEASRQTAARERWPSPQAGSVLVQVLLLEGDDEGAWREARNGGCYREIWLKLAERRAASHPEDALAVYRDEIAKILVGTGDGAYQEAVELLRKVEAILIDDHDEFARVMADLRLVHRRKRNLMKLLDAEGW